MYESASILGGGCEIAVISLCVKEVVMHRAGYP